MKNYFAIAQSGKLQMHSRFARENFSKFLLKHDGCRIAFIPVIPESKKQRKFYHGAVLKLWAYLNGWDYKDNEVLDFLHHEAKNEFNGEIVMLDGKQVKRGKSTKAELNKGYLERVIDHLEEQYGIDRMVVLNPETYKDFVDRIYGYDKYDDFIDYMLDIKLLKNHA